MYAKHDVESFPRKTLSRLESGKPYAITKAAAAARPATAYEAAFALAAPVNLAIGAALLI